MGIYGYFIFFFKYPLQNKDAVIVYLVCCDYGLGVNFLLNGKTQCKVWSRLPVQTYF